MGGRGSRLAAIDRRIVVIAVAAILLAGGVAAVVFSSATVTLMVAAQKLQTDLQLQGSAYVFHDTSLSSFPTQALSATATGTQGGPATGQQQIAAIAATGEVVFVAASCGPMIPILAGTLIATSDGIQFMTNRPVSLCAGSASANVQATAVAAGAAGNVFAGTISGIVHPVPGVIVTNPAATTGGADARTATVIQQRDVDTARQQLLAQLDGQARANLTAQVQGQRLHLITSSTPQVTSQLDQAVGTETPAFSLSMTETLKGVAFSDEDVHQRLRATIMQRVPAGYTLTGDPIRTWFDVTAANDNGSVTLSGHGLAYTLPVVDRAAIERTVALKTRGSAAAELRRLPDVVEVRIDERPLPLPFMPPLSSRISINVFEIPGGRGT